MAVKPPRELDARALHGALPEGRDVEPISRPRRGRRLGAVSSALIDTSAGTGHRFDC
jgi:hypothetical protein